MATPKPRSAQLCSQSGSLASIIACIHCVTLNGWGVLELAHADSNFESHTVYDFPEISILFLGGLTFLRLPIIVIIIITLFFLCLVSFVSFSPFPKLSEEVSESSLRCPTVCLPITGSWPHFLLRCFVSHSRHSPLPSFLSCSFKNKCLVAGSSIMSPCHYFRRSSSVQRLVVSSGVQGPRRLRNHTSHLRAPWPVQRKCTVLSVISEWCLSKEASTSWSYITFTLRLIHEVYTVYQCMYHLHIVYVWTLACNPVNVPNPFAHCRISWRFLGTVLLQHSRLVMTIQRLFVGGAYRVMWTRLQRPAETWLISFSEAKRFHISKLCRFLLWLSAMKGLALKGQRGEDGGHELQNCLRSFPKVMALLQLDSFHRNHYSATTYGEL